MSHYRELLFRMVQCKIPAYNNNVDQGRENDSCVAFHNLEAAAKHRASKEHYVLGYAFHNLEEPQRLQWRVYLEGECLTAVHRNAF
jgi:hypothetical protein